jgi:hypothetical protein
MYIAPSELQVGCPGAYIFFVAHVEIGRNCTGLKIPFSRPTFSTPVPHPTKMENKQLRL